MFDPFLQSPLTHVRAQGANVGDIRQGPDGAMYRWTGAAWTRESGSVPSAGTTTGGAGFNFNWSAVEKEEFEKLRPYYEKKLADAQGDVTRAKTLLEEDYQTGMRRTQEDESMAARYRNEDLATQGQGLALDAEQELRDARGALNQRGVLIGERSAEQQGAAPTSDYAQKWFLDPMKQRQDARRLAVERSIQRQGEVAGLDAQRQREALETAKRRGIQEQETQYDKYRKLLEQEQKEKAVLQMTPLRYQQEYQKYQNLRS